MSLNDPSRRALVAATVAAFGGGFLYTSRSDQASSSGGDSGEPSTNDQLTNETPSDPGWTEGDETETGDDETESEGDETGPGSWFYASDGTTAHGVELEGKPIWGSPDAPIEIYAWTDFQCPFCKHFEEETLPGLVEDYVKEERIRFVLVQLPYAGEDSMTAAVAGRCAWEQVLESDPDTYWNWHSAIMAEQEEENSGWATAENLVEYTRSVPGVSADQLETCLEERRSTYEADVRRDENKSREMGVDGTPTFTLYNTETGTTETIVGAQPRERFDKVIGRLEES